MELSTGTSLRPGGESQTAEPSAFATGPAMKEPSRSRTPRTLSASGGMRDLAMLSVVFVAVKT